MKNIFSKTTENRTQNGVKSYLSPTFVLSPILIFAFLTLGVGQMWADNGDFYNMYIAYSFEGAGGAINGNDNNTGVTVDAGTLTSGSLTLTGVYLKCWDDWGKNYKSSGGQLCYTNKGGSTQYISCTRSGKSGNNYEYQNSNPNVILASYDQASGSFEFHCWGQTWGDKWGDRYFPKSSGHYVLKYKIAPPAVSGFGVTPSGHLAGSGTEGDPYLVASGSNLTLTASGSQAHTDEKSSINYKFGNDDYSTTATKNITVTSSGSIAVKARCKNTSASLDGAETETITIYYAPVSVKDISVYIYVGGCTPAQINSIELFGTPCVGSVAQAAVHKFIGDFTTDGDWRKYTFTNVSEVRNVVVAREGGRAVDNITITDDIYYKFDGAELDGKCVPPANPTWGTAPANGVIGGSMTASVSGAPAGATVEWSSSAKSYATVDNSGHITYVAAGNATITAHVTWSATGDYCAGSYDLTKEISCTSGATVTATRACPEYVSNNSGQVKLDISSTGASTGWYYRVCNSAKTAYYAPDEQSAANNTLSWTMNGALPTGSNTLVVELYNSALQYVCTSNPVTVNVEIAELVTISAGANGSVSPSGTVYANNNHVHPTITATPNEHYHFVNWTSNNAAASVADANSATTTVTATASGYTITANFAGDQYRITYKDQGNVNYSGNNEGSLPATHTYGTATDLVNGTKEGFTFGGWYTNSECTVSAGSSIGATAKTSNFTLYAKWTEKMSALSTSNHYNVGNPGYAAPTVSNSATNVGYETTRTITATAVGTGYRFVGWTLTNCTRTDGGEATANQITIRSNGDGAAASVVANYEEYLSTEWKIIGQSPSDKANSPFSSWTYASSTNTMAKATGHSTESVAYATISVPAASVTGEYYEFKISNGTTHYGYGTNEGYYILFDKTKTDQSVYSNNNHDHALRFKPNVAGDYTFKIDYSNNTKKVSVTFPVSYTVT